MSLEELKKKNAEYDRAIEKKRRELLAEDIGKSVAGLIEPAFRDISKLSTTENIQAVDRMIDTLNEVKNILINHEITIEI